MGRSKQQKFKEFAEFPNTFEYSDNDVADTIKKITKGKEVFLELGCGKGEYTLALAELYPEAICIGVDVQGERLWVGAKQAIENELTNAYFLRAQIENIDEFIPPGSVSEIWINYPDPFPKDKQAKKRLTSQTFLEKFDTLLLNDGTVHLKTDSKHLYNYSIESIKEFGGVILYRTQDIFTDPVENALVYIPTTFEDKHLKQNKKLHYLSFQF